MIGLGNISNIHMETYERRDDVWVKAIADSSHGLLLQRSKEWGIRETYPDYQFMLKDPDIDVIDIMTPHFMHAQCVCDALAAGKTVICEKPLTTTTQDLARIMQAIKKSKKHVYVKQYLRFSEALQKMKHLITEGVIGKPYYIYCIFTSHSVHDYQNPHTWKGNRIEAGGGIFMDVGVHIIDVLQSIFGSPVSAYAQLKKISTTLPQKGEDVASAILEFPDGLLTNIACTENDTGYKFRWEVHIYGPDGVMNVIDQGKKEKTLQVIKENNIIFEYVEQNWWKSANIGAIDDIITKIASHEPPLVSLTEVGSTLRTILASYRSSQTQKKVSIKKYV